MPRAGGKPARRSGEMPTTVLADPDPFRRLTYRAIVQHLGHVLATPLAEQLEIINIVVATTLGYCCYKLSERKYRYFKSKTRRPKTGFLVPPLNNCLSPNEAHSRQPMEKSSAGRKRGFGVASYKRFQSRSHILFTHDPVNIIRPTYAKIAQSFGPTCGPSRVSIWYAAVTR
jgi:hypothetical protein